MFSFPVQDGYGDDYGVSYRTMQKFFELLNERKYEFESNMVNTRQSIMSKISAFASPEGKNNRDDADSVSDPLDHHGGVDGSDEDGKDRGYFSYSVEVSIMEIYNEQVRYYGCRIHIFMSLITNY